tara:strand:+ start:585 stop:1007 length:423 start_codon:yes stop_codon:yes gene_type:complete
MILTKLRISNKRKEKMGNYIDAFVLPIPRKYLNEYKQAAKSVAVIWKEHGALAYYEYVGDDLNREGTSSFPEFVGAHEDDAIIFGWVLFESHETRDLANERVATDPRMGDLIAPLTHSKRIIFDAKRMAYGGFKPLIQSI